MQGTRKDQLEKMIAGTANGDRGTFAALYEVTSPRLHAICLSVLKDRPEAEEALQEVYIRIWQGAGRHASSGLSPMTWLITIARNRAVDRLRARTSRPISSFTEEAAPAGPAETGSDAAGSHAQKHRSLDECLVQLGEDRAGAVRAAYLEGLTYADLSARVDMPVSVARNWLRRSLLRLKDCVSQ